ncbi:MAG: peptide deformylase [Gammaproteobacteria bacterium]
MANLRQIAQLGHPVLRKRAETITEYDTPALTAMVDDMLATLRDSNGVGLAAPQIYEPYRIIIIASRPNARYLNAPNMEPVIMLNPRFQPCSDERHKDWEGCLSIPGIRALVPRYRHIEICYDDIRGNPQACRYGDFIARIFQHEYDHLDGLVYLDRVENNRDIISEKEFFKRLQS